MEVNFSQQLCECSLGEIAEAFIQGHDMSYGIEFVSNEQLARLIAIALEEQQRRS